MTGEERLPPSLVDHDAIATRVNDLSPELVSFRRDLHRHPSSAGRSTAPPAAL